MYHQSLTALPMTIVYYFYYVSDVSAVITGLTVYNHVKWHSQLHSIHYV